ncbi:unnamed protein product [Diplocarpon coronariae]
MSMSQLDKFLRENYTQLQLEDPASPGRVFIYDLPKVFMDNFPAARLLGPGVVKGWTWHMNVLSEANIRPVFQSDVFPTSDYLLCKPFLKSAYVPGKPSTSVCGLIFELAPADMSRFEAHIQRNSSTIRYKTRVVVTVEDNHTRHLRCLSSTTYIDPLNTSDGARVYITSPAEEAKWLAQIKVFRAREIPDTYLESLLNQLRGVAIPNPQPIYVVPMKSVPSFTPPARAAAASGYLRPLPVPHIPKESSNVSNTFKITPESVGIEKFTRYFQTSIKSTPSNLPHVRQELQDQFDDGNERYRNQLQAKNQHQVAERQLVSNEEHQARLQEQSGSKQRARMQKQAKSPKRARVQSEDEDAAKEAARAQSRPQLRKSLQPLLRPSKGSQTTSQRSISSKTSHITAVSRPQSSVLAFPPPSGIFRTTGPRSQTFGRVQSADPLNPAASEAQAAGLRPQSSGASTVAPRPISSGVLKRATTQNQMTAESPRLPETAAEIGERRLREYARRGSRGGMWGNFGGPSTQVCRKFQTAQPVPARPTGVHGAPDGPDSPRRSQYL